MNHVGTKTASDRHGNLGRFGVLCLTVAMNFGIPTLANANAVHGVTDDCSKGGIIIEHNFFGSSKHFTVHITNKQNGGQDVMQIDAGVIPSGGEVTVHVPPPGPGIDHCDAFNTSVAVGARRGGPGGVRAGAKQQLKIEALFVDPSTHHVVLGSIFDFLSQAYPGKPLLLPDLWGDTTGDSIIGPGDFLYSLVDINAYTDGGADPLADVNARFVPGQEFQIVNGMVAGLPGMLFSTTEFTFDAVNGYEGTPYNGSGFAVTNHEPISVPEPPSLALFFVGLLGAASALISRRRSSATPGRSRI